MDEKQKNKVIGMVRSGLSDYLSEAQLSFILPYFIDYPMRLKIVHVKKTYWGLCRYPRRKGDPFLITLVRTDVPAHFFLVFLHEIAHMLAHLSYGEAISSSHGKEWGMIVRNLVVQSANSGCFSNEELRIIAGYVKSSAPLSNARMGEMEQKVLKMYKPGVVRVGDLPSDAVFTLKNDLTLKFIRRLRKYYECLEPATGKRYRVSPDAEVERWNRSGKDTPEL